MWNWKHKAENNKTEKFTKADMIYVCSGCFLFPIYSIDQYDSVILPLSRGQRHESDLISGPAASLLYIIMYWQTVNHCNLMAETKWNTIQHTVHVYDKDELTSKWKIQWQISVRSSKTKLSTNKSSCKTYLGEDVCRFPECVLGKLRFIFREQRKQSYLNTRKVYMYV